MELSRAGPAGLKDMRRSNELAVLDELYRRSPSTRTALARATGVTKPTVSAALASLIDAGLVEPVESGAAVSKYGAELFQAAGRSLPVLGLDVGTRYIRAQLAGLDDRLLAEADTPVGDLTLDGIIVAILHLRTEVCREAGIEVRDIQAIGIGVPGVVHPRTGRVEMAGGFDGLNGTALGEELSGLLGARVIVENDVNAAALAERQYGACVELDDFAMISVGAGVGAALVLGGRVHRGRQGSAGELDLLFGLDPRGRTLADPSSEAMVSYADALLRARGPLVSTTRVTSPVNLPQVFAAAESGDPFAQAVVDEAARRIAALCACLVAVADVDTIVLIGGIGASIEPGRAALEARLAELVPWPTALIQSSLGRAGTVQGARSLAVREARREIFAQNLGRPLHAAF
ncbi:ROK family transcriptional regulator [Myceligenerans salitolerans]|uniref:ROK family transcriptional regulator n=1 Tax=Myceligenerans salitolerans TaxID=1230528 RepID=A0ABS3ID97_9MICO|nr:ROK family transcriptional regulator [Myceligenerans salitolerans]MBO0610364.1 ROK family transcriptional regulator [Myceligenerans salitolerans]